MSKTLGNKRKSESLSGQTFHLDTAQSLAAQQTSRPRIQENSTNWQAPVWLRELPAYAWLLSSVNHKLGLMEEAKSILENLLIKPE